eukprot:360056-Chlamydomonas_euryale.AAC.24
MGLGKLLWKFQAAPVAEHGPVVKCEGNKNCSARQPASHSLAARPPHDAAAPPSHNSAPPHRRAAPSPHQHFATALPTPAVRGAAWQVPLSWAEPASRSCAHTCGPVSWAEVWSMGCGRRGQRWRSRLLSKELLSKGLFPLGRSPAIPGGPHKFPGCQFPLTLTEPRGPSGKY